MKKFLVILLLATVGLAACQGKGKEEAKPEENMANTEKKELIVFAAASMTETMEKIKGMYEEKHPDITLTYTFDSSGTLKTQIEEGADCDLFISAAGKQMNALDPAKAEGEVKTPIDSATRVDLLENKVTLAVPSGNPKGLEKFEDMNSDKVEKIALGNSDVPVGQYSEELLTNLGIWEAIQSKVTFGSNVKEVTTWVSEGVVDCGIVYQTDAYSAGLQVLDMAEGEEIKTPVIYPAAVLKNSKNPAEAAEFLSYLQGEEARKVFEEVGFSIVK